MKVSFSWLSQYIDLSDYQQRLPELSQLLTSAGLEVEDIQDPSQHWGKVVVGELLEVGSHPDADKLTLCQVNVGQEVVPIVCGAKNHRQGDRIAVAQVGAVLKGDFRIKKSKIRGVESMGMLCSESELGLAETSEGILILPKEAPVGEPLAKLSELTDIIFELNVTPNRADCLSHLGLARELSTLLDRPVMWPKAELPQESGDFSQHMKVQILDTKACPRYCGRLIEGVQVGESPDWLKKRVESIGLNSVNNVVDVTNFVLFEYGQPLHAFDLSQIQGGHLQVGPAQEKEKFTSLDGSEFELTSEDLVIRDQERPVALAGVVGGKNSGVTESTKTIFLESAFFRAEGVRRTARFHGIETDSCYRFSRGVDPAQTRQAMDRAASLIQEVAGGKVHSAVIDEHPEPQVPELISISPNQVEERLGYPVSLSQLSEWLKRLNCEMESRGDSLSVRPPSYRWDLKIKEDLIEEYARLQGYDQLGEVLPELHSEPQSHDLSYMMTGRLQSWLTGLGWHQSVNYAFIAPGSDEEIWGQGERAQSHGLNISKDGVELMNPISEELSVMRVSLLPSLLKNFIFNHHRGNASGKLFEVGPAHGWSDDKTPFEENRLALLQWGKAEGLWTNPKASPSVLSLKSEVEALLVRLGCKRWRWDQLEAEICPPGFHPGRTARLFYEGSHVGLLGEVHPGLMQKNKLRVTAAWAELNWDQLMLRQPRSPKFQSLPKFPAVDRDVAFVASSKWTAQAIIQEIRKQAGPLLVDCQVFDHYQDEALKEQDQRSMAFRLRFQSEKETLTDEVVNGLRDKLVNSLCQKPGLEIR